MMKDGEISHAIFRGRNGVMLLIQCSNCCAFYVILKVDILINSSYKKLTDET